MPTINQTSASINLNRDEMTKHITALPQCIDASEVNLLLIEKEVNALISTLDNPLAQSYKEYESLQIAKSKVIKLSEQYLKCLENRNSQNIEDCKEIYNVWVENLLLNYELITVKLTNNIDSSTSVNELQAFSKKVSESFKEKDALGFSLKDSGELRDLDAADFEKKLPQYFAHLPIGICIATGKDLVFQFANKKYLEIVDKDSSIIGHRIVDTLTDFDTQVIYDSISKVYNDGIPYIANGVLVKLNRYGAWHNAYFDLVCEPLRDADNTIIGIFVICTEVTETVLSRKILQESEHKFRSIIDKSPVAKTILRGPQFKVELANKRMLEFFWKRTLEEVQDRPFLEIFPELESQDFPKRLRQVFNSGVAYSENNAVAYVDSADGRNEYILDYEYAPLLDEEGKVDGVLISAYDVTERVKSEQKLKVSENRFKSIASVMQQFIWTASPAGELDYFNPAVFDFSGRTEEDLFTNGWLTMIHPDDREENIKLWTNSIKTGSDFIFEHRFRKANGDYRWQLSRAVAQRDNTGKILQWVGTSTDIHDQIKFQETLEDLVDARTKDLSIINIELQSSNQDLESFAYISSHDLQEPLRKIQTFISIILDSDYENLSERGKSYFLRVESAAARMKRLITDLLTYSRTSAVDKDFEKVDLKELLEEIEGDFLDTLEEKNGAISIQEMPMVNGISFQLRQLFVNLISNSIKFAQEGQPPHIDISQRIVNGEELDDSALYKNQNYVEITLRDNGIGFRQEYASKIFEVFQRLHAKGTYDGTGIGLAICKKIIDKHHGQITATSNPGKGATFKILLPLED